MTPAARGMLVFVAGLLVGANLLYFAALRGWLPGLVASRERAPAPTVVEGAAPPASQPVAPEPAPQAGSAQPPQHAAEPGSAQWWRQRGRPAPVVPTPEGDAANASKASSTGQAAAPVQAAGAQLLIPVAGVKPEQLHDTFQDARGQGRIHDAIDIMAPTGTPVHAVADGRIVKLFESERGGLTLYQFDTSERWNYYYAHLDSYAEGIEEGMQVRRGKLLGYVGYSGNASPEAPHLHFAVHRLGPERNWWQGEAVNPYPLLTGRAAAD